MNDILCFDNAGLTMPALYRYSFVASEIAISRAAMEVQRISR